MKILMATMGLDIGGAETHIVELTKELRHQGHEVVVVSNGGVYVPEITAAGIRHYNAPMHRRTLGDMLRSRAILRDVIRREKPDVVHAHARIPAFLCGTLQRRLRFPFVTTAHWVFDASGILRYLTNWGQRTIAVSDDIKSYLMREYHLPAEHISVTINGIDTEKFSPDISGERVVAEFGLNPHRPIVSYVSRMDQDRALVARQLIEIAPQLDRAVPGVQLLIAGGGNVFQELLAKAKEVNAALGRPCVTMAGPRTDINEIVAAGDIFVGVSRAALEAMSAGKPVIVAGNEGYHGLFGPEKLEEARAGNFCCRGLPMSTPERLRVWTYNQDLLWSVGNAAAAAFGAPFQDMRMAGYTLHYHFLNDLAAGLLARAAGAGAWEGLAFYWYAPVGLLALGALWALAKRLGAGEWLAALGAGAVFFMNSRFSEQPFHLFTNTNGMGTALLGLCGVLLLADRALEEEKLPRAFWPCFFAACAALCMIKSTLGALALCAFAAALAVSLVTGRLRPRMAALAALCAGAFGACWAGASIYFAFSTPRRRRRSRVAVRNRL